MFPGADGEKPLATLTRLWTIVRAAAQLDDVRLHDLRHSFASVNASSGGSLLMIGKLLGHKHAATTSRYAHLLDDPVRAAADQTAETLATWMVAASAKLAK